MKKLIAAAIALAVASALTACSKGGKGGGGDQLAYGPNSCLNYRYDANTGYYYDSNNRVVQCNNYGQNYFWPGAGNQFGNACDIYRQWFPYDQYVPLRMQDGQLWCVKTTYYMNVMPMYSSYYMQGIYPSYTCQPGVNCGPRCFAGAGANANVQFGGLYLGGTLGVCFQ